MQRTDGITLFPCHDTHALPTSIPGLAQELVSQENVDWVSAVLRYTTRLPNDGGELPVLVWLTARKDSEEHQAEAIMVLAVDQAAAGSG